MLNTVEIGGTVRYGTVLLYINAQEYTVRYGTILNTVKYGTVRYRTVHLA